MQGLTVIVLQFFWISGGRSSCDNPTPDDPNCFSQCSDFITCAQCLATNGCGWCSISDPSADGDGWCTVPDSSRRRANSSQLCNISNYRKLAKLTLPSDRILFYNVTCPKENECENGHHDCDLTLETCVDTRAGFECQCKEGYERRNGYCVPVCNGGCVNGACVQPNVCQCALGFVGSSCQSSCNCNGHSTCPGPTELDTCLKCHNNTKGSHCEICEPGYIRKGNSCILCRDYCHGHSDVCRNEKTYVSIQSSVTGFSDMAINAPDANAVVFSSDGTNQNGLSIPICDNCSHNTKGFQCEICLPGYYRPPKSALEKACIKCNCNGHSVDDVCNPQRGDGCQCRNNTKTPDLCNDDDCPSKQCSICKDNFFGDPTEGRPCYRKISETDQDVCFNPAECSRSTNPRSLQPTELSFFALQPEYLNVDLRIILDVGYGAVDVFLAVTDEFVVRYDSSLGYNILSWRSRSMEDVMSSEKTRFFETVANENESRLLARDSTWTSILVKDADDSLANYVTYTSRSLLVLRNIANRVVIVAPSASFDFKSTHFYLVIRARQSSSAGAWGNLLYTQDQAHFDLFIFFAVFFAAFFLALSLILVIWRLKMLHSEQLHVRAQTVELLKMAKRPISSFSVVWTDKKERLDDDPPASPFCYQNLRKKPVTVATFLVRMPGGAKAPVKAAFASTLLFTAALVKPAKTDESPQQNAAVDSIKKGQAGRYWVPPMRRRIHPY